LSGVQLNKEEGMICVMPLTPAVVLAAAIALLDEAALDGFSTRKLATRLGVQVGALYWHYPSKRALLDAVADHIVGEAHVAAIPDDDRLERAGAMIHALRNAMLAHADGARLVAEMGAPGPAACAYIERLRGLLTEAGMDSSTAERAADVLTSYLTGHAIEEQAHELHQRAEADSRFAFGLNVVLAGLRTVPMA
jgi:TetR/AcrR family tetracycline transcriptional repressor